LFCILVTQTVLGTFIAELIIFIVVEIFFSTTNYFHSANIFIYTHMVVVENTSLLGCSAILIGK